MSEFAKKFFEDVILNLNLVVGKFCKIELWYVSRRAIFGAGMGRDAGYYCDVLSSGVNLFFVEGSSFYSIHWSFIVQDLLATSWELLYQVTYTIHRPTLLPTPNIYKGAMYKQH